MDSAQQGSKPSVLHFDKVAFFDCDETLVFVDDCTSMQETVTIQIPGFPAKVVGIHTKHVERLKNHKVWGNGVVVWSKSGYQWADAVVKALKIEEYVDQVMAKPEYYYDDKKCCDFMPPQRFLKNE